MAQLNVEEDALLTAFRERKSQEEEPFTEERMVRILRASEATSVAAASKRHGVSAQTIYLWKKKFAGMGPADVKRLKEPERENSRLKELLAGGCPRHRGSRTSTQKW